MSLQRSLAVLVRPHRAFGGWTQRLSVAVGLVVLLCVLNAGSVTVAGDAITGAVDGTVRVDNPERPPDWVCGNSAMEGVSSGSCDEPATIEQRLGPVAASAVGAVTLKAAVAPAAWVLLIASLFVLGSGRAGEGDGRAVTAFRDGFAVAAVAAVPGVLRYAARPVAVERALGRWRYPQSVDGVRSAAVHALFPDGALWVLLAVLTGLWTAAIVYDGALAVADASEGAAAGIAVVTFLTGVGAVVLPNGGWTGTPGGVGLVLLPGAIVGLLGARTYVSIAKDFELIGFRGKRDVEPRGWYVGLHRLVALLLVALGFVLLDGPALV